MDNSFNIAQYSVDRKKNKYINLRKELNFIDSTQHTIILLN